MFKLVNHTFELMVFLYLIPFAFKYMMSAVESGQVSPACHIPMYYVQAAPLVSFILVAIRIVQRWFAELKVVRDKEEKDPQDTNVQVIEENTESEIAPEEEGETE